MERQSGVPVDAAIEAIDSRIRNFGEAALVDAIAHPAPRKIIRQADVGNYAFCIGSSERCNRCKLKAVWSDEILLFLHE
jgi:hypothetical protein